MDSFEHQKVKYLKVMLEKSWMIKLTAAITAMLSLQVLNLWTASGVALAENTMEE